MCIHCLGHFSSPPPSPSQFQAGPILSLSLILLKKRHIFNMTFLKLIYRFNVTTIEIPRGILQNLLSCFYIYVETQKTNLWFSYQSHLEVQTLPS
jgi:hypothetical protein